MSSANKKNKTLNWPLFFAGFFFLLVFVFGMQWLTTSIEIEDWMKVSLGIFVSALVGAGGMGILKTWKSLTLQLFGQAFVAIGFGGIITSLLFGGFAYDFYPREVTALLTGIISLSWILYSHYGRQRILLNLSLVGMFAVPFAWGPEYVWPVFIYLLLTHAALSWTASRNKWMELTILTNIFAWSMLLIYAISVGTQNSFWGEPLLFLLLSLLYLRITTWLGIYRSEDSEKTVIYFRPFMDIGYSLLAILIFFGWFYGIEPDYAISLFIALIGVSHGISAWRLPHLNRTSVRFYQSFLTISSLSHLLLASFVLNLTLDWELKIHILMITWSLLAFALTLPKSLRFRYTGWAIWIFTILYGYVNTWGVDAGEWFGVYLPFLNTGALAWILTAIAGYRFISTKDRVKEDQVFYVMNTILTCLIIGGLLIVQTDNAFEAYGWSEEFFQITLSGVLGLYALCWFLFSIYIKQRWMELISFILLAVVGLKALFYDLWSSEPVYKMILFAILGIMSFIMVWIDRRVNSKEDDSSVA